MARSPVLFNRSVEVPAGKDREETIILTNNYRAEEQFSLSILEGDAAYTGAEPVAAQVNVPVGLEEALTLHHRMPIGTPPGLHPFTIIARLHARDITLRLPGIATVPAIGQWDVQVELPEALQPKGKEGEIARGEAADPELRPWQGEARAHVVVTNHSSDWLYCNIELLNKNDQHWIYELASSRVCLPPWSGAHTRAEENSGDLAGALDRGSRGIASTIPEAVPDPPEVRIPLILRPKKRIWFGKLPEGAARSNLQVKIERLNPESVDATASKERALRVVYKPMRHPFELLKPAFQKLVAFAQFAFSKRGALTVAGLAAMAYVIVAHPINVYYQVREAIWPPKFEEKLFQQLPLQGEYYPGQRVVITYSVADADVVELSGLPENSIDATTGNVVGPDKRVTATGDGRVEFVVSGKSDSHVISLRAIQERKALWGWKPKSKTGPHRDCPKKITINVAQKPIPVPSVIGKSKTEAEQLLKDKGFVPDPDETGNSPGRAPNSVLRQDPPAGTRKTPGATVTIVINAGSTKVEVPDVAGKSEAEATRELQAKGLVPKVEYKEDGSARPGIVLKFDPKEAAAGEEVNLTVSKQPGPRIVKVDVCAANPDFSPGTNCRNKRKIEVLETEKPSETCSVCPPPTPPTKPYVWQIGGNTTSEFAKLAAAALTEGGAQVVTQRTANAAPPTGAHRLAIVGPEVPKNPDALATQLRRLRVPVLGLGEGGVEVLVLMDNRYLPSEAHPESKAYASNRAMRALFSPDSAPSWAQEGAQVPIYTGNGRIFWCYGTRLMAEKQSALLRTPNANPIDGEVCVGFSPGLGFWGAANGTLTPQAREIYQALVRRIVPTQ